MPTNATDEVDGLYRKYAPVILRRAQAILGDEAAAQDALQEIFVSVVANYAEFRKEASPATWLYRITTNQCLRRIRDERRREELRAERLTPVTEEQSAGLEERATLTALLRKVPDEIREIAVYYYVDDMSQDEIAELLGVARRTIGNRLELFRSLAAPEGSAEVRT